MVVSIITFLHHAYIFLIICYTKRLYLSVYKKERNARMYLMYFLVKLAITSFKITHMYIRLHYVGVGCIYL